MADACTQTTRSLDEERNNEIGEHLMGTLDECRQVVEQYKKVADKFFFDERRDTGQACTEGDLPPGRAGDQIAAAISRAWQFVRENRIIMDAAINAIIKLLKGAEQYMAVQILRFFWGQIADMIPKKRDYEEELNVITNGLALCEEKMAQIETYVSQVASLCDHILQCNGQDSALQVEFDTASRRAEVEMTNCQERLKKVEEEIKDLITKVRLRKRDEGAGMAWIGGGAVLLGGGGTGILYWYKALTVGRSSTLGCLALCGFLAMVWASAEQEEYNKFLKKLDGLQKKKEELESSLQELRRKLESEARAVEKLRKERGMQSPNQLDD